MNLNHIVQDHAAKLKKIASIIPPTFTDGYVSYAEFMTLDGIATVDGSNQPIKIQDQLNAKSATGHDHNTAYSAIGHNHDIAYHPKVSSPYTGNISVRKGDDSGSLTLTYSNGILTGVA